jgi:hypothetical protein
VGLASEKIAAVRGGFFNMSSNYWAAKRSDGWAVKKEGATRASSVHDNQSEAWGEARRLARGAGGEAYLKGHDGKIRARNTYGKDPFPPKG